MSLNDLFLETEEETKLSEQIPFETRPLLRIESIRNQIWIQNGYPFGSSDSDIRIFFIILNEEIGLNRRRRDIVSAYHSSSSLGMIPRHPCSYLISFSNPVT
uniref:Uncharacterized protein n=1 Tax=Cacopsylla melanoneura TaxID=428564 RepID=A0A8D8R9I8_9HEMI